MLKNSDQQIVKAINSGDKATFEQLFFTYYTELCLVAYRIIECEDTAKDVVQNIFMKLWKSHEKWNVNTSLRAYLYSAVRNQAINQSKGLRNRDKLIKDYSTETIDNPNNKANRSERADSKLIVKIWDMVDKMPDKRRIVFTYHRRNGLTYKEISEIMHISQKTVENHMGLALKYLRDEIERTEGDSNTQ